MARNTPGAPDFDPSDLDQTSIGNVTFLGWGSAYAAPLTAEFAAALAQLGIPEPPASRPDGGAVAPAGPVAAGGADSSPAAVAAAPPVPRLPDYGAAQHDAVDFAALLAILSTADSPLVLHESWLL